MSDIHIDIYNCFACSMWYFLIFFFSISSPSCCCSARTAVRHIATFHHSCNSFFSARNIRQSASNNMWRWHGAWMRTGMRQACNVTRQNATAIQNAARVQGFPWTHITHNSNVQYPRPGGRHQTIFGQCGIEPRQRIRMSTAHICSSDTTTA